MNLVKNVAYSNTFNHFNSNFKGQNCCGRKYSKKAKKYAFAGTAVTTVSAMALMRNKAKPFLKGMLDIDYNAKNIIKIGLSSIAGGLTGGLLSKEGNSKKKFREANYQAITNIICPTILADQSLKLIEKASLTGTKKRLARSAGVVTAVGTGMIIGRGITKLVNGAIFKNSKDNTRQVSIKDVAIHVDDIPMVFGILKEKLFGFNIAQLVPLASMISGFEAGKQ